MTKQFTWIALSLVMLSAAPRVFAGTYTFEAIPATGGVAGLPGSTVGWGYTISNLSPTDWLVTTGLNSDPFLDGTAMSLFDFPDLGPGTSVTVAFDPNLGSGLYQLTWDPTAPAGTVDSGLFTLSAEWWDGDPVNDSNFLSTAPDSTAFYSASVIITSETPEPSCLLLIGTGLLILGCCGRVRGPFRSEAGGSRSIEVRWSRLLAR